MQFRPTAAKFLLFSFSAASLALFPIWFSLFQQRSTPFDAQFFNNHHQLPFLARLDYAAGAVVMLATTVLLFTAFMLARRFAPGWDRRLVMVVSGGLLLHGLNVVRVHFLPWASFAALRTAFQDNPVLVSSALLAGCAVLCIVLIRLRRPLTALVFLGAPAGFIVLINVGYSLAVLGKSSLIAEPVVLAPVLATPDRRPRVIWIIFDELDYRLAFEDRPADLDLPHFDRLRATGLFATQATPPGTSTFPSIPALTLGQRMTSASFSATDGPVVRPVGQMEEILWARLPSVFSRARERQINVAILGQQYMPYCRVFHQHVSVCREWGDAWPVRSRSALDHSAAFANRFLAYVPVLNRRAVPEKFDSGLSYLRFQKAVLDAVGDPRLSLIFTHWMIPHAPNVYDRKTRGFTVPNEKPERYFDNVALADRMLGETIETLNRSGMSDRTFVIVSSDHPWRQSVEYDRRSDTRVPFIVLRHRGGGVTYSLVFNTVVTGDLVLALLDGDLTGYDDIAAFIDRKARDDLAKDQ